MEANILKEKLTGEDFEENFEGEVFGPLRDPVTFRQVNLDPQADTVVRPTGADFNPATLHDWPEHEPARRAAARGWAQSCSSAI